MSKDMRKALYNLRHTRKAMAVEYKGGKCQRCGYNTCLAALEFHHENPKDKKFTLTSRELANRTWKKCLVELDKCKLVCANCHREIQYT